MILMSTSTLFYLQLQQVPFLIRLVLFIPRLSATLTVRKVSTKNTVWQAVSKTGVGLRVYRLKMEFYLFKVYSFRRARSTSLALGMHRGIHFPSPKNAASFHLCWEEHLNLSEIIHMLPCIHEILLKFVDFKGFILLPKASVNEHSVADVRKLEGI